MLYPLTNLQPRAFSHNVKEGEKKILNLPLYPELHQKLNEVFWAEIRTPYQCIKNRTNCLVVFVKFCRQISQPTNKWIWVKTIKKRNSWTVCYSCLL